MLLGKVFSVNTVLFGQKEDRTYKTESHSGGQKATGSANEPKCSPNSNVDQVWIADLIISWISHLNIFM